MTTKEIADKLAQILVESLKKENNGVSYINGLIKSDPSIEQHYAMNRSYIFSFQIDVSNFEFFFVL